MLSNTICEVIDFKIQLNSWKIKIGNGSPANIKNKPNVSEIINIENQSSKFELLISKVKATISV